MLPVVERPVMQGDIVRSLLHSCFKVADPLCHQRVLELVAKLCDPPIAFVDSGLKAIVHDLNILGQCGRTGLAQVSTKEQLVEAKDRLKQSEDFTHSWLAYPGRRDEAGQDVRLGKSCCHSLG